MVSSVTIASIAISLIVAVGAPIALLIIFKKKFNISLKVLIFGVLTFILFAQVLEGLVHGYFLVFNKSTKAYFDNVWLFMLYGGLMAGIFEETGRFIVMKFMLKKYREWKDGLAFGLGHGGIEAMLIVGVTNVTMIVLAFMINGGTYDSFVTGEAAAAMAPLYDQLTGPASVIQLFGGVERLGALAIHLGLSILVLYGIRKGKNIYLLYAILIHAVMDFPAALYQKGIINIFIVEAYLLILAIGFIIWIVKSRAMFYDEKA
ncbi:YhfC family intramembrane metalloprotease [Siminovitchia acidinfaciens]|uniref:YhfC family intramembrane metalloprotease n=1 Tax=Siminovitchia acidinfaciens TaxID=2321395 RepID=A0A429Y6E1_9BACI|nr:YhfC family intramembrane metalloprotease [Siminovitchia acidinfaciens]RST77019.1 YhfC family intramembrane metalloprotease [Siminovitchia acidinfaciens]